VTEESTIMQIAMKKFASKFSSFLKKEDGVSAVEFAFTAPALVAMYFMFVGLAGADHASSRVGQVASTVSDIISQSAGLTATQIDLALQAGEAIAGSQNASGMDIEVVGVLVKANGQTEVAWSRNAQGSAPYAVGSSFPMPASLTSEPGFIVASRTAYTYQPVVGSSLLGGNGVPLEYKYYYVPRVSADTVCNGC